jgi:hypothetical protein
LEAQNWVQVGGDFDGEAAFGYSGRPVALSGDGKIFAIGAPGNDGNGDSSWHVRVLRHGTNWAEGDGVSEAPAVHIVSYGIEGMSQVF